MRARSSKIWAVAALVLALCAPAYAQTPDAPAKPAKATCHDADGKPAKCVKKRRNDGTDNASALRCRDVRTHRFTKCGGPYAEPVPAE
jgi:hypothetical protein